jgi:hypothetical protein
MAEPGGMRLDLPIAVNLTEPATASYMADAPPAAGAACARVTHAVRPAPRPGAAPGRHQRRFMLRNDGGVRLPRRRPVSANLGAPPAAASATFGCGGAAAVGTIAKLVRNMLSGVRARQRA